MNPKLLLPREHGAWGMLLTAFCSAAVLGRAWNPLLIPALLTVLIVFAARAPVEVLLRQRFLWRDDHPETHQARRTLLYELTLLAACTVLLSKGVPFVILGALALGAACLTAIAVYMTLKNRQRSVTLQAVSSIGLASSGLLSGYLTTNTFDDYRTWALLLLLSLHFLTGICLVHARLDRRAGRPEAEGMLYRVISLISASLIFAVASSLLGHQELVTPLLASAAICGTEVFLLLRPASGAEPLQRVGWRTLAGALVHAVVVIVSLW